MTFDPYRGFGLLGPGPIHDAAGEDPIARLKQLIGFSDEPVQDAQGFWTIGYGQRLNNTPGGPKPYATISEPIAEAALRYRFAQDPDQFRSLNHRFVAASEGEDGSQSLPSEDETPPAPAPQPPEGAGAPSPQSPQPEEGNGPPTSPPSANVKGFQAYLNGLSRRELQELKNALSAASRKTQAFSIVLGGAMLLINPATWVVTVTLGFFGVISLGLDQCATEIDKRLNAE